MTNVKNNVVRPVPTKKLIIFLDTCSADYANLLGTHAFAAAFRVAQLSDLLINFNKLISARKLFPLHHKATDHFKMANSGDFNVVHLVVLLCF